MVQAQLKDRAEIEDIIDIAELFIESTERHIERGLLGGIDQIEISPSTEPCTILFNIIETKLEININRLQPTIIDFSECEEKDIIDLAKEITKVRSKPSSFVHYGDMSWEDFYREFKKLHSSRTKRNSKSI